ncbi:MAG: sugar-phosphatase, partial [Enterococcus faecalis]|nr:sugar-phosphatase [Enterococcus faecalis]
MSIKLVAIDIDGTLLNSQHKITPRVKEALQKANEQGVRIVLCTGRPLPGVKEQLDELALYGENDFVITYNGSLVQATKDNTIISRYTLSYEDFLEIEMYSRKVGAHLHTIDDSAIYTANRNIGKYTVHESTLVSMPIFYRTPEEMADKEIVKCMFIDEPEILDAAIEKIPAEFYERYSINKSAPFYLELLKKNVDKGSAITHLAEKLGLTKDETMAIGDEENDRAMLEVVGNPV